MEVTWQFVGGVLIIGTLIGLFSSALFWLAISGGDDGGEEEDDHQEEEWQR